MKQKTQLVSFQAEHNNHTYTFPDEQDMEVLKLDGVLGIAFYPGSNRRFPKIIMSKDDKINETSPQIQEIVNRRFREEYPEFCKITEMLTENKENGTM